MANQGEEMSSNANPSNQNNIPQDQEVDQPARPRRTRFNLGGATGGSTTWPPPINWSQLAARVSEPPPPPLPPTQAMIAMTAHLPHKCTVCSYGFRHKSSLGGHMRIHSDRPWRGLIPPSNLSQSVPSSGVGVGSSSGGLQAGASQSALLPWIPLQAGTSQSALVPSVPLHLSANVAPNTRGGETEGEMERGNLRKRSAPPEEQTSRVSKRSKRTQEGWVPDLNDSPPSHEG